MISKFLSCLYDLVYLSLSTIIIQISLNKDMVKYTKSNLRKLEQLFTEQQYTIRYEKGNFQSGYCIVQSRKIVVINKFFDVEARINCLLDILSTIIVMDDLLSDQSKSLYRHILRSMERQTVTA